MKEQWIKVRLSDCIKQAKSVGKVLDMVKSQTALAQQIGLSPTGIALGELHELIETEFEEEK